MSVKSEKSPALLHRTKDWRPRPTAKTWMAAFFRNRDRQLVRFSKLPTQLQYLYIHSISIPQHNIVFAKNSKAGCTSVAYALRQAICNTVGQGRIHNDHEVLIQGYESWPVACQMFQSDSSFRFTTVRNPLKRTVSAFLDIFVERRNPASKSHQDAISFVEGDGSLPLAKRFSRFVDFIQNDISNLGTETDRHWRPQVQNIAIDHVAYTKIGRIEEASHWLPRVFQENDLPIGDTAFGNQKHNASTTTAFDVHQDDARRVEEIFRRDFDLYETLGE